MLHENKNTKIKSHLKEWNCFDVIVHENKVRVEYIINVLKSVFGFDVTF